MHRSAVPRPPGTHRLLALIAALLLVTALSACGDEEETGTGGTGIASSSTAPDGATEPGDTEPAATGPGDYIPPVGLPDRDPDLIGTITASTPFEPVTQGCIPPEDLDPDAVVSSDDPPVCTAPDTNVLGTILVEASPDAEPGVLGDRASLTLTSETSIWLCGPNDARMPGMFEDASVGQSVHVWVDGPVAESYPVQATANALALGTCG